jgi:glycosyltransferase involved in cell wall biosynthesis
MDATLTTYYVDARTSRPSFPGIGRYITNLTRALIDATRADEQLRVLVPPTAVQLRQDNQPWSDTLPRPPQVTLHMEPSTHFSPAQQWRVPWRLRQLQSQARSSATPRGLYHSPYYLLPYVVGMPSVVTLHDLIALILPETVSPRARWLFRLTAQAALRTSTHVIIGTESARQELLRYFRIDPARVTTVPHAAASRFHPQSADTIAQIRARHTLPDDFLLYLGINKPHKNLVRLIEAYAALGADAPPLVIAGAWDPRYPEAKQTVAAHGLTTRVRFLGPVDDGELPALYAACGLFVFPSLYEGFGLPVLEAMACGAAVACSDTTGLSDVAGDAALLFPPDDVDAMTTTLRTALARPELRADLRTRALVQAGRFSWSSTAASTLDVYRHVLTSRA